ncbi:MAG: hypothetical protein IJ226_04825 [Clostridia bacterium]|nr:hypothetical protein [Clostridia bacterium]
MKILKVFAHVIVFALVVLVAIGVPTAVYFGLFEKGGEVDAVSRASVVLPDKPSGEFVVLINTARHEETVDDWRKFFTNSEFVIIFDDVSCLVAIGDSSGKQMAERFQAELPENQMKVTVVDATLLASKAEIGYIDIAIFSREMADAVGLKANIDGVTTIIVHSAEED